MRYRVTAEQRKGWPGRWRSGRHFVAGQWVELDESEVTGAMRADPALIVEEIPEPEAEAEKPKAQRGRKPAKAQETEPQEPEAEVLDAELQAPDPVDSEASE